MPTYFGYVEREADSYINWAEIGKGISDTVNEIDKVRNEKKAALDQVSKDFQRKLSEYPTGQDRNANEFAYRYSDNASQFMLMQQRLLKQGKLKLKDYLSSTQNIMDDTENAFSLVKTYQDQYGKVMEQYRNKEISLAQVKNFAYLEGFGGFVNTDLIINPLDGSVSLAKMETKDVDGKKVRTMAEGQQNLMSVGAMKQLMNTPIPRYDMEKETSVMAKGMGKNVQLMIKNGVITSFDGIRKRMYGKDILKSDNPDDITDVLLDNNFDFGGIAITETEMKKDEKGQDVEVKTTKSFANREFDLADKYLEIKNKPDSQLTDEEKKLKFSVERSLKGSEQDQKMMFEYQEAENKIIKANLVTPYNYMSALIDNNVTDKDGNPYDITWDTDEAKKNPNLILARLENGTVAYDLTPKQKEVAENAIRDQIRAKLDEEMKYVGSTTTPEERRAAMQTKKIEAEAKKTQAEAAKIKAGRPTKADYDQWYRQMNNKQEANFVANLHNGTPEEITASIQYYRTKPDIWDVLRDEDGITVIYAKTNEDGDKEPTKDRKTINFYTDEGSPLGTDLFYNSAFNALYTDKQKKEQGISIEQGRQYIKERTKEPEKNTFTELSSLKDILSKTPSYLPLHYDLKKRIKELESVEAGPLQSNAGKTGTIKGGNTR